MKARYSNNAKTTHLTHVPAGGKCANIRAENVGHTAGANSVSNYVQSGPHQSVGARSTKKQGAPTRRLNAVARKSIAGECERKTGRTHAKVKHNLLHSVHYCDVVSGGGHIIAGME